METKALKKQLGAAIAMVVVAAIALGSATYAWFVTNNTVKATTTTISAQSNAAFMTIANGTEGAKSADTTEISTEVEKKALYPATIVDGTDNTNTKGTWMTGYGKGLSDAALQGSLIRCAGTTDETKDDNAGTTKAAVAGDFALQQDYNISCKSGQTLKDLKVQSVTGTIPSSSDSSLATALRVLVTDNDGTNWAVYGLKEDKSAYEVKLSSATDKSTAVVYANEIKSGIDTAVHVYLYYEGSDTNVTTKNLVDGKLSATNAVTVTFTATPNNK